MKRIGLMGCGAVASYGHIPAILSTKGLKLVSLFDPNPENLQREQSKHAIPNAFTNQEEFLNSGLDALVITSPVPVHLDNVKAAATHKLPVLCEKPLAMTDREIARMITLMAQAKRPLYTAFCYRFSPAALKIKALLDSGAIGTPRSLRLIYIWNCHGKYERGSKTRLQQRRHLRMLEGGPMVDCGVHQIDLARWWVGDVARTSAAGAWVENYAVPDHMYLHLDHTSGAHTMVEISYSYAHTSKEFVSSFKYELIGTKGLIRYDREAKLFELRNDKGTKVLPFAHEKAFEDMYKEFSHALHTGKAGNLPTADDGLAATRLARSATEALAKQHQRKGK